MEDMSVIPISWTQCRICLARYFGCFHDWRSVSSSFCWTVSRFSLRGGCFVCEFWIFGFICFWCMDCVLGGDCVSVEEFKDVVENKDCLCIVADMAGANVGMLPPVDDD